MEMKILKIDKEEAEIEFENLTMVEILRVYLNKDSAVTFAAWKRNHPTEKPLDLMEYLVKTYTNEGDTVLDNCIGSGTTAIACINTGRNYIGIEKEEKYYRIAEERIRQRNK